MDAPITEGLTFLKASPKRPVLHEAVNTAAMPPLRAPSAEPLIEDKPACFRDALFIFPSLRKVFTVSHKWGAYFNTAVRMAALRAASPD